MLRQAELVEGAAPAKKEHYAFIIPSYREDPELLGETLMHLAIHTEAKKKYLVFLAMEAHEDGSVEKAQALIAKYSKYFKVMSFSHHTIREFEQKGKASNVSWCAEHLEEHEFKKHGINPNDVFLTIIDADSWVPEIYISEVQERIDASHDNKYKTIFMPGQMYTRNNLEVPISTRVYDLGHGCIHFANMVGVFAATFPLSNYTLSFNLIKRIGFWDTCPDAIGEDFHTTLTEMSGLSMCTFPSTRSMSKLETDTGLT
jgi:cellulose synthase/poly-beta-1,6-N-acetylglucosamine synthase-like glycosyltransferase